MKYKILGIITARGGSKGIPGKNIKELGGKPLIVYTIDSAKESGVFDRIILSTDDKKIADVGHRHGVEVPFMRPNKLAQDKTSTLSVLQHAVKWLEENENYKPDFIMILQPTSPLRQAFHIRESVEFIKKSEADSVLSVAEIPEQFSSNKSMTVNKNGFLRLSENRPIYKRTPRRQDLPQAYWSVGSIYLFRTKLLFDKDKPNFYGEKTLPYVVDAKYVVDIDEPEDWLLAEQALKKLQMGDL